MEPLKQWVCDSCGELIEKPEDGYLIWKMGEDGKIDDMRIVHHNTEGDDSAARHCDDDNFPLSSDLNAFIGAQGIVQMLSLIDPGRDFIPEYHEYIGNMRLFVEIFRRLQIPYYEEARLYWNKAIADGYFNEANEIWSYLPENLKVLITKYKI